MKIAKTRTTKNVSRSLEENKNFLSATDIVNALRALGVDSSLKKKNICTSQSQSFEIQDCYFGKIDEDGMIGIYNAYSQRKPFAMINASNKPAVSVAQRILSSLHSYSMSII